MSLSTIEGVILENLDVDPITVLGAENVLTAPGRSTNVVNDDCYGRRWRTVYIKYFCRTLHGNLLIWRRCRRFNANASEQSELDQFFDPLYDDNVETRMIGNEFQPSSFSLCRLRFKFG